MLRRRPSAILCVAFVAAIVHRVGADEPQLSFVAVSAESSGLTHVLNSEPERGALKYPWMSPPVDIDGDGRLDLIVYGHHGGGAAVWLNQGERKFALDKEPYLARWPFGGRDPVWWQMQTAAPPWGFGTEGSGIAGKLFRNDGAGHFQPTTLQLPNAGIGAYQLADLDGDGRHHESFTDGEAFRLTPSPIRWPSQVDAKLKTESLFTVEQIVGWPTNVERGSGPTRAGFSGVYAVDVDGDDRNELIVHFRGAGFTSESLFSWVLRRTGDAWRDATTECGLPTDVGHWLFPEDVDTDGDLDLVDLHAGTLFTNDGRGRFAAAGTSVFDPITRGKGGKPNPPWTTDNELEWLDLDNNGFRDLVTASDHGTHRGAFLNLGAGRFVEVAGVPGSRRNRKFGDVDDDGRLDMITFDGKQLSLHRNEAPGGGLFVRLEPHDAADVHLGAKLWVYEAGKLGDAAALLHYRQGFMERNAGRSTLLIPRLHVGIGDRQAVDVRVRFPSGAVREARGVTAGEERIVKEL